MEEQSPLSMQPGSIPVFNALRRHSHLPCSGLSWSILARPCQSRCQSHNDISISRVQPLCQEGTNSYEHHQTTCLTSHWRPQLPSYSSFCLSRGHQAQQKVYIKKASFRHKPLDDSCRILLVDLEWSRSLKASFFAYFTFCIRQKVHWKQVLFWIFLGLCSCPGLTSFAFCERFFLNFPNRNGRPPTSASYIAWNLMKFQSLSPQLLGITAGTAVQCHFSFTSLGRRHTLWRCSVSLRGGHNSECFGSIASAPNIMFFPQNLLSEALGGMHVVEVRDRMAWEGFGVRHVAACNYGEKHVEILS